ncbi:glutamate--cysteine ligase [Rhodococcus oryzae]|uniref:Glutamate--cysteine ligase n=1 Tax=Rhodococcus oryzae TaxID=2571143 RepID=A0ABY2RKV5_9NOCA|nr:glutamate--cysteine ligase [Rhodococcus oryzae]TJZ78393.1 glutamate--cysteine ligase [Rhodococcus oryzae]
MGHEVTRLKFSRRDRRDFREKVQACLDALATLLENAAEIPSPKMGMEIELNLVDENCEPAMVNAAVLADLAGPKYQSELAQFNIEINVEPRPLAGANLAALEDDLRASLDLADARARESGGRLAMIGILPTLREGHFEQKWMSSDTRYTVLEQQILAARGEDIELSITGVPLPGRSTSDHLTTMTHTILPEAACTSVQLHLQVSPATYAAHWNAAQILAGIQVVLAANSPFFAGRALWHETRIPLFEQATDTRPPELKNQGVRPRVWFGERWITSVFDLFEENSRYFPALLPDLTPEDPVAVVAGGGTPELAELTMHNGTIYRWNRPVYDPTDGRTPLRLENRVLPAGPTIVDTLADAAFYYGTLRSLARSDRPLWTQMPFAAAEENLRVGARHGFDSVLQWPGNRAVSPQDLVQRTLLPMADAGLEELGVDAALRDKYLGVIEGRARAARSGSVWQRECVAARERAGQSRDSALRAMLCEYLERMHSGEPVHTWSW